MKKFFVMLLASGFLTLSAHATEDKVPSGCEKILKDVAAIKSNSAKVATATEGEKPNAENAK